MSSKYRNIIFLGIVFIAFFFLIALYIGPVDDVMYQFFIGDNGFDYSRPIVSLRDAVQSQWNAYCGTFGNTNGRLIIHVLCQLLCGSKLGVTIFSGLSALFFVLLIVGIQKIIAIDSKIGKNKDNAILCYTVIIYCILLLTEDPGKTLLGSISFTTNYLWASAINVWAIYIFLYFRNQSSYSPRMQMLTVMFCIIAGSLQESFSIPICGAFMFYVVFKNSKLTRTQKLCIAGYAVGCAFLVLAPSNYVRFLNTPNSLRGGVFTPTVSEIIFNKCKLISEILLGTRVGLCSTIIIIVSVIYHKRVPAIFHESDALRLLVVIAAISYAFAIFVVFIGAHQLTIITIVITAILTHCIMKTILKVDERKKKVILFVMWLPFIVSYVPTYAYRYDFKKAYDRISSRIQSSTNPNTSYDCSELFDVYKKIPSAIKRYTPAENGMMHFTTERFFETCSYLDAFKSRKGLSSKFSLIPISVDSIEHLNEMAPFNAPIDIIQCDDYFILRYNKTLSDVSVEYNVKPGLVQKIIMKLGKTYRPIERLVEPEAHTFESDSLRFTFIFLDPAVISYISPAVHNHTDL